MFDPTGSRAFRASFCIGQVRGSVGRVPRLRTRVYPDRWWLCARMSDVELRELLNDASWVAQSQKVQTSPDDIQNFTSKYRVSKTRPPVRRFKLALGTKAACLAQSLCHSQSVSAAVGGSSEVRRTLKIGGGM